MDVARDTMASSESSGRSWGSKSDRACDDEAVASGTTIGSDDGATTAKLRADARCDLLLSALWKQEAGGREGAIFARRGSRLSVVYN